MGWEPLIVCLLLGVLLWIGTLVYLSVRLHSRLDILEVLLQELATSSAGNSRTPTSSLTDAAKSAYAATREAW